MIVSVSCNKTFGETCSPWRFQDGGAMSESLECFSPNFISWITISGLEVVWCRNM